MAKVIMVQGTMSNAGKSVLVAGLCRIFKQDGYRVAPFKSQNMALNSYVTKDGFEMGRAQVMQAEAAGIEPEVIMNPILLKPTNDIGSQVIVNGKPIGNMNARDYFAFKKSLVPNILEAYRTLALNYDIIVIEGAGSPAEINLKSEDIVNMGMAEMVNAPVLLVGDIDRGGVFAQLIGTIMLLDEDERKRVCGLIINKFRGDKTILDPGLVTLEAMTGIPVVGVTPYLKKLQLEDEDSLTDKFTTQQTPGLIDLAVIRYPRISNFTDFHVFEQIPGVTVRYITSVEELKNPDMICLPGTKNTMSDLIWLRQNGLEAAIKKEKNHGTIIFGICGGYQMLGNTLNDLQGIEEGGTIAGMGFLPMDTYFEPEKQTNRITGNFTKLNGIFEELSGKPLEGYEIHMGQTLFRNPVTALTQLNYDSIWKTSKEGVFCENVYGTYVHGIFDKEDIAPIIISGLARKKGIRFEDLSSFNYHKLKEEQYDYLADELRKHLDMKKIYQIMEGWE